MGVVSILLARPTAIPLFKDVPSQQSTGIGEDESATWNGTISDGRCTFHHLQPLATAGHAIAFSIIDPWEA